MAEEIKTEEKKVETPAPALDYEKLGSAIADGVSRNLKPVLEAQKPAPQQPAQPVIITAPSDEEIEAAQEAGDKAKVRELRKRQREADKQEVLRTVGGQFNQGVAAINQLAEDSIKNDKWYQKYKGEVDQTIAQYKRDFPNVIITTAHFQEALKLVKGQHADDIASEAREEYIRQQRDAAAAPSAPTPDRGGKPATEAKDPDNFEQAFGTGFVARFREKTRANGGRSEDAEIQLMDRFFRERFPKQADGKTPTPAIENLKGLAAEARELDEIRENDPSLGLGS